MTFTLVPVFDGVDGYFKYDYSAGWVVLNLVLRFLTGIRMRCQLPGHLQLLVLCTSYFWMSDRMYQAIHRSRCSLVS